MPLVSVDAVQLTRTKLADCATAVTPAGTVGAVVSAGGGGGGAGGAAELSPPPPPHADNERTNDATVANTRPRFMTFPFCYSAESGANLTPHGSRRRRTARARDAGSGESGQAKKEVSCRRTPRGRVQPAGLRSRWRKSAHPSS